MSELVRTGRFGAFFAFLRGIREHRQRNPYEVPAFVRFYGRAVSDATHATSGEALIEEVVAAVGDGGRVVEVGVGTGLDSLALARRRPDVEVIGCDPNRAMLDAARARPEAPRNLSWVEAGAQALPFADASVDVVFSASAIKHFPDPRGGVAEMVRILRPGGLLLVAEVSPWVPWSVTWRVVGRTRLPLPFKPLLALRLRRETAASLPDAAGVTGWFTGHPLTEPFGGLEVARHPTIGEIPFLLARLRKQV